MSEKEINADLVRFVEEIFGTYDFDFMSTTSIENDLGISGEEGVDFIKQYSKSFNVDISEFIFSDYFYPEPSFLLSYKEVKSLTLGDLESGIKEGVLK